MSARRHLLLPLTLVTLLLVNSRPVTAGDARLYDGLGGHHRKVAGLSPEAQRWFDQGLVFAMSFNHDEAVRSFTEAARIDPDCAMAWWGIALASGPHINNPAMSPEASQAAWSALNHARSCLATAAPVERALVEEIGRAHV